MASHLVAAQKTRHNQADSEKGLVLPTIKTKQTLYA